LDKFKLPIDVIAGHLGELVLQIPWSNLKNKPVKIVIEDVFLLAAPKMEEEYDAEEEEKRAQALKKDKLENMELIDQTRSQGMSQEEIQKNQSFTDSLVTKIVDNLQVTIKNIHIRYEDKESVPNHPFSLGLTLGELSAVSTDDNWNPIFVQDTSAITKKLATLNSLAVYWNTDAGSLQSDDDEWINSLKSMIPKGSNDLSEENQYILRPVSGLGRITMNKQGATDKMPKTNAQLLFDDLGFVFDSDQYRDALWTADLFHVYMKTKEFKKYRPNVPVKKDPKAWFKFAGTVVLKEIHQRNREWSWDYMRQRREDRLRYIVLYKKKKTDGALNPEETAEFDKFEWDLSYDDLRFYRSLAKSELRKEKAHTRPQQQQQQQQPQSWYNWFWGTPQSSETQSVGEVTMTDEQKKELYDAIEWDEKSALESAIDIPRDRVTLEVGTSLRTGSFRLKVDPHGKNKDLAVLSFSGFNANFYQRPDSFLANFSLHQLRVDDKTGSSLYEQVVSVKSLEETSGAQEQSSEVSTIKAADEDAFFWVSVEHNPLDESADTNLFVKLRSMTVFYNSLFVESIVRFFKPPKTHLETIGAIMNAAGATVEGLRDQTRIGLEYALEEHKTVNLKMDVQAPLIVVPLDVKSWDSPCAILDAGHISVTSDLVGRDILDEVKSKQSQQYTDQDWKRLESLMYDKFNLQLHDTQFLIGVNVRDTMKQLHNKDVSNQFYIVDRINMDFLVEISILPSAHSLTKFKVSGQLPMFRATMSDAKYKLMMKIIDKCIPNFDFEDEDTPEPESFQPIPTRERGFSFMGERPLYEDIEDTETLVGSSASSQTNAASTTDSQKIFEFNFRVNKVELSLYRCQNESTLEQESLVDMNLDFFELDFYFMSNEMFADVTLNSLSVDDYIDTNSPLDLRKMVSSRHSSGTSNISAANNNDLFNVKYRRMKRINEQGQELFDQNVDITMSTLRFVLTPKSSLTLLDFIITTFTDPNGGASNKDEDAESVVSSIDNDGASQQNVNDAAIDVKVNLHGIILVLNDDGIKVATMRLDTAVVGVKLVSETMKVESRIGSLSLHDDVNEGCRRDSILRQLVSIEGDDLMDFKYETFDPNNKEVSYNSSIYFRAGSIRVNVVEEPFTRIFRFLFRVLQMKGLFDSARQAAMDQANQIEGADKIHFDVLIKTPILVFPRPLSAEISDDVECDTLTAHLGEIYLENTFDQLEDEPEKPISNSISAGIRSAKLTTNFVIDRDEPQFLEIIDNLDIKYSISYVAAYEGMRRPSAIVSGSMSDIKMKLTELQFKYLLELSSTVPTIFTGDMGLEEEEVGVIEDELKQNKNINSLETSASQLDIPATLSTYDLLDFSFQVDTISLTLFNHTEKCLEDEMSSKSVSSFSLNDSGVKFRMKNNSSWETDVHVHSFTVYDTREVKDNKFTEIIPSVSHNESQFMCRMTRGAGPEGKIDSLLTIDTPRMILALEYLFALKEFVDYGLTSPNDEEDEDNTSYEESEDDVTAVESVSDGTPSFSFHVNIVDASLILLANPTAADTEALVFKTEQLVMSQRATSTLSVSKIGMYLCQMNRFDDSKLRVLDDFSFTATMDMRGSDATHQLSSIQISVEPLVLRLSLRDMLLAIDIMTKASALSSGADPSTPKIEDETPKYSKFSRREVKKPAGTKSLMTTNSQRTQLTQAQKKNPKTGETIIRGEELNAEFEGLRFVIIGMYHELPMIDMSVKPFTATARNWSSDLKVDVGTETFTNVYNPAKSAWEPLIETWDIGFHISKTTSSDGMFINLFSRRMMEVTLTSQTIMLLNHSLEYMQEKRDENDFLTRPRESGAPYRVKNETGYTIEIWTEVDEDSIPEKVYSISDGQEIPWRFYDWNVVRENLSTDMQKVNLGVRLKDSPYDPVRNISVTSVGEHLHILHPKTHRVLHRLLCEVKLEDDLKKIILRSALNVDNRTHFSVQARVSPSDSQPLVWSIEPGCSRAIPIQYVYDHPVEVRPDPSLGFSWAKETIQWKKLVSDSLSMTCRPESGEERSDFYFQVDSVYDKTIPLTKVYPHMTVTLSAPIEIINLLPFDFDYRIYDKNTRKDWSNMLKRGESSPVHVIQLSHLLLLSVHPKDAGYDQTDFAVINSTSSDFKRETNLVTRSNDGQKLILKLHYS
jgi:vacuolar protein sorting-associated protein 13A/C